jgi:hypothetical protein
MVGGRTATSVLMAQGNYKNVCGSDNDDYGVSCAVALLSSSPEDCGDEKTTTYSHGCTLSQTTSSYIRERRSIILYCEDETVHGDPKERTRGMAMVTTLPLIQTTNFVSTVVGEWGYVYASSRVMLLGI